MPANLTPEYKDAEEEFKAAKDPQGKLACLEKMLSLIPKHKGTEKMQADLKHRISALRDDVQKKSGKKGFSVTVERVGAVQVALVGAPNSGKSTIIETCTNAKAEVADYPFSTKSPVPAMFTFENLQFQLVDLPPVSREHLEPWVTDIIRNADSAIWVVDASDASQDKQIEEVQTVLSLKKIELVGAASPPSAGHDPIKRLRTVIVATKMDEPSAKKGIERLRARFEPDFMVLPLSPMEENDFTLLGRTLFDLNQLIRVFSKMPGKDADRSKPYVLHRGDHLMDFARLVHKDFAEKLSYAKVWGEGKFPGQRIQRDQELADGDVVELHM